MDTEVNEITSFKTQYPSFIRFIPWHTTLNDEYDDVRNCFDDTNYDIGYYHKYTIDAYKRSKSCPPV